MPWLAEIFLEQDIIGASGEAFGTVLEDSAD